MGTQGTGRKRIPNRERLTAEDDALNQIAREAEARLAAKRAARAEAREIRMKELERQQKEIYQVQKKYYGLDNKWGDIEQWMEDSERYSRHSRRNTSVSDDEERMSVGSRGSLRSDLDPAGAYGGASVGGSTHSLKKSKKKKKKHSRASNGYEDDYSIISSRSSRLSDESKASRPPRLDLQLGNYSSSDLYSTNSLPSSRLPSSTQNGSRPSLLCSDAPHSRSLRGSVYEDSLYSSARRFSGSSSRAPSEYSGFLGSNSRASSRASSARASPVVEERSDRDFLEKGSRTASTLSAATLASLGGTSSRRGSGDTALSVDTEASIREIKEIHELKDQIQDVEAKHMQSLKEVKDSLVEVEEKYRKAMVSNAQLDNEKSNLMYQVDTLKDSLMELEEQLCEARREFEAKAKDFEREKYAHSVLQFQFNEMKETLKQSEELLTEIRQLRMKQDGFVREISDLQETVEWKDKKIGALERQKEYSDAIRNERDELRDEVVQLKDVLKKHGIVLGADLTTNGEAGEGVLDGLANADSATRLAQDSQTPHAGGDGMLEIRLRKLVDERETLMEQVKRLKAQLEQKQKNGTQEGASPESEVLENGTDPLILDVQRDANRQISDLKFKLVKSEQEVTALEQNVIRLEGQVTRYKSASENAEKVEDELKAEKRRLQRELRSALDKLDELEASNSHLVKRLEKMKANRSALLSQQ
ncbi:leucine-rich repeat flightless-interacting protein 2 isoform X21 [Anguilla anguilla]|uniref:leucine-rich repeat flightless-interacting protein 2 isoform X21 n=1 Tax=Anguilla anguilla TaxID=7936 RepID=UPI0015B13997|nr:leucine-rich repeat flightless-interacting protein 2 isoform X21 [Anguilla anguilla]